MTTTDPTLIANTEETIARLYRRAKRFRVNGMIARAEVLEERADAMRRDLIRARRDD